MKGFRSSRRPASSGYCTQRAKHRGLVEHHLVGRADLQLDAERFRAAAQHLDGLREAAIRHQERAVGVAELLALHAVQQRHRLAGRRSLIQQRGVRHRHPRQVRDHRLEIEERLEAALGDLGLVGRVGRVPARVLEHVAADDAGNQRVGVTEADEAAEHLVLLRNALQPCQVSGFAFRRRQVERRLEANARGDGFVDELIERRGAHCLEHLGDFIAARTDVTWGKRVEGVEKRNLLHILGSDPSARGPFKTRGLTPTSRSAPRTRRCPSATRPRRGWRASPSPSTSRGACC